MKKFLALMVLAMSVSSASASTVYWMLGSEDVSTGGAKYAYATLKGAENGDDVGTDGAFGLQPKNRGKFIPSDMSAYSLFFAEVSNGMSEGESRSVGVNPYSSLYVGLVGTFGMSIVPEPVSGVLVLLGVASLCLRRKKDLV